MDNNDDRNREPIINDLRHSRAGDVEAEPTPPEPEPEVEAPVEPEEPVAAPEEAEPVIAEAEPVEASAETASEAAAPAEGQPQMDEAEYQRAEMEQMKMIFGMGLKGYLSGQIALLINFTMINLGRAPNPATGLVSTDLEGARVTIDLLEKIMGYVSGELKPTDQASLTNLVSELKYSYVQAAANPQAGIPDPPEAPK